MEDSHTFEITRDANAGGGFQVAIVAPPSESNEPAIVCIGSVASDGPASQAGMDEGYVGWRIVSVNDVGVDATTYSAALDATRIPQHTFMLTVRRPRSGEFTVASLGAGSNRIEAERYIDPRDLNIYLHEREDGSAEVRLTAPSFLVQNLTRDVIDEMFQALGLMRSELSQAQVAQLAEEEAAAGEKDVDSVDDSHRCIICLNKQRAIVLQPCSHWTTCHKCTVLLRRVGKCPICRQRIEDVKVFSDLAPTDTVYIP
jgi:hypothetical protein